MHTRDYLRAALTDAHARAAADANEQAVSDLTDLINGLEETDTPDTTGTPDAGVTAVPHYGDNETPEGRLNAPRANPGGPQTSGEIAADRGFDPGHADQPKTPADYVDGAETWDQVTVPDLEAEVQRRNITIAEGSGADGAVIKDDLVTALIEDDDDARGDAGEEDA